VRSVLVFGGTFDPVHDGHLAIATQARAATGADAAWFVPAALAPLREPPVATPEQRLELLLAATGGAVGIEVLDIAIRRGGVSYTAETMEALHGEHPDVEMAILIGADVARTIGAWHRAGDLLAHERFVVVNRTGPPPLEPAELEALGYAMPRTVLLSVVSPDISASEVRRRCAMGEPLDGLVPPAVAAMIAAKGLYRSGEDDA
jgi:nicotinate-nucleotide adenylyltransferase